jgi:tripartite ATP-independent transporter DctM subunit
MIASFIPLFAILGAPLFAIIAAAAMVGFHHEEIDLAVVGVEIYRLAEMPVLTAIPLFAFAGYLLGESQAPKRLLRVTRALLGWMPGNIAVVGFITCALFTAFTGASGITIIALGALLYPALQESGYGKNFSLGLITSSGSLGLLFAPSVPLIIYGVVAQQLGLPISMEIQDLFLAGLLPGLLMLFMLSVYGMWQSRKLHLIQTNEENITIRGAIWESKWELPLPLLILGGIYGGLITIPEAAAVTAAYVLIVEVLINRDIPLRQLPRIMREAMVLVGAVLIILAVSLASMNYLIDAEIPSKIFSYIETHIDSKWKFLMLLNIFLLLLGTMLDIFSALLIMVPIILPVAINYGVHPVHLGIIFLANMQIGYFTPPVGMNLFIASYRFNEPVFRLYRATFPFFIILLLAVLIITYWPQLSLVFIE